MASAAGAKDKPVKLIAVFASSESHGNGLAKALVASNGDEFVRPSAAPSHWLSASGASGGVFPIELGFRAGLQPGYITDLRITAHPFCMPAAVRVYVSDDADDDAAAGNALPPKGKSRDTGGPGLPRAGVSRGPVDDLDLGMSDDDDDDDDDDCGGGDSDGDYSTSSSDGGADFGSVGSRDGGGGGGGGGAPDRTSRRRVGRGHETASGRVQDDDRRQYWSCTWRHVADVRFSNSRSSSSSSSSSSSNRSRSSSSPSDGNGGETKVVRVGRRASFVKLVVPGCHVNAWNTQRRAGLAGIVARGLPFAPSVNPAGGLTGQ
jgi:hypothetical protein